MRTREEKKCKFKKIKLMEVLELNKMLGMNRIFEKLGSFFIEYLFLSSCSFHSFRMTASLRL